MTKIRLTFSKPLVVCAASMFVAACMTNFSSAQLIPAVPDVPDVVQDVTNTAQDAVQGATQSAQDVSKDVQDTAQDVTKEAKDSTNAVKDAADDATKPAKDAVKDTTKTVQDTTKDVEDTTKDATKAARDTAKDVEDTARDAQRDLNKTTRDVTRESRNAAEDATDDARDAARNANRNARDAARNATRDLDANVDADASINARGDARTRGSASAGRRGNYRSADLGVWFDRSAQNGLIIADVAANTALSAVGFREGDRIVSIGGQTVTSEADFVRYLTGTNLRGRTNVVVMRDGQQHTLYVQPEFLNQRMTTMQVEPLEVFGIIPDDRYNDRVVVWRVIPRSPAFYSGIRPGDVITSFANRPIANLAALAQLALQTRAGTIPIQVTRNGRTRVIQADFPDVQVSDRHTTFRQDLDADVNVRSNLNSNTRLQDQRINADADAELNAELNTDTTVPTIRTDPQNRDGSYSNPVRVPRRALRRGR